MSSLKWIGRRICGALLITLILALPCAAPGAAQDLRLPLRQGQTDLALFALSRTEARISTLGRMLLQNQGFLHRDAGPRLQSLTSGHNLTPTLRHDPNINDGIPSKTLTLGGLRFRVTEDSQAKPAVLAGLRYTHWHSWSYAQGARLRLTQTYGAELEPTYGYHHASANIRLCLDKPVASWTWLDTCVSAGALHDGIDTDAALTGEIGGKHLFETAAGYHQLGLSLSRVSSEELEKSLVQIQHSLLTHHAGLWKISYGWGENIPGENTLRQRLTLDWTGELGGRIVEIGLSELRTGGADLFGIAREDRITKLMVSAPFGKIDLGAYIERRRSTIDAYCDNGFGILIRFRTNLL